MARTGRFNSEIRESLRQAAEEEPRWEDLSPEQRAKIEAELEADQNETKQSTAAATGSEPRPPLGPDPSSPDQGSRENGFALTILKDLLAEPEEKIDWVADNMLPESGLSISVAKPKVGKSTLARNLAFQVARGEDFLGRKTQKGSVIYLALEEKRSEVRKHFRDLGATGEEEIYIFVSSAPADTLEKIRIEVQAKKPILLIIDPLFRFTRVKDVNDYAQVTLALEPLLVLARETHTHVHLVHHAGKKGGDGGDSILGSTAIFGAVDTAIELKRKADYRTISTIQRYGKDLPETILAFDLETRTITLGRSREEEDERKVGKNIIELVKTKGEPLEEKKIGEGVEGRNKVKKSALRALVKGGQLYRAGNGKRGDPYLYAPEKSWFSSSLPKSGDQKTRNEGTPPTSQNDLLFSGSRNSRVTQLRPNKRESETCRFCKKPACFLTEYGQSCRLSDEDRKRIEKRQNAPQGGSEMPWETDV